MSAACLTDVKYFPPRPKMLRPKMLKIVILRFSTYNPNTMPPEKPNPGPNNKITIIKGPPPVFEDDNNAWANSLIDGREPSDIKSTRLLSFNFRALVKSCHDAWKQKQTIYLQYLDNEGEEHFTPIIAARPIETKYGYILLLWLKFEQPTDYFL